MRYYVGIDLGTSGMKGLLLDVKGNILRERSASYSIVYPKAGWSEQNPEDWLIACKTVLKALCEGMETEIAGLSFGGQMHGLVLLDKDDNVIRPAILWNDGRTEKQTRYLNESIGREKLSKWTANIAFAGFTAPKILWIKENEPQNFARIVKIMLPKDYLAYKLTGVFSTDYSDASGTLLLDVKNKCWSKNICKVCSVKEDWLPKLYESYTVIGKAKPEYGLPNAVVTAGAGDNAAAAIGTGTVNNGDCNISLGTSGTVFIAGDEFSVDKTNALHSFAHATGKWHLMGCILSAASANKWWVEGILGTKNYDVAVKGMEEKLGKNDIYFLPYLIGERSPHNDVNARGTFIGLRADTTKEEMSLAVLEGVAFALRDCVEVAKANGITVASTKICGGGAQSGLWKKIIADVLGMKVSSVSTEQGPAYGAAILSMVGAGEYQSIYAAVKNIIHVKEVSEPDFKLIKRYDERYRIYKKFYPALKESFLQMQHGKNTEESNFFVSRQAHA